MKRTFAAGLVAVMALSGSAFAQSEKPKDEAKQAGEAAKDAGKAAGEAGKHAGKAAADASKKTAKTVKKAVTGDAHATCVDGTRQAGPTEKDAAAACSNHGGVAKK
jgi:hypothetical protein